MYKRMMDINSLMFNHVQLLVDVETEEVLYSTVNRMFNYLFEENNKAGGGFFNMKSSIDNKDLVWLKAVVGSWTHFLEVQDGNASEYCFITVFPIKRKHIKSSILMKSVCVAEKIFLCSLKFHMKDGAVRCLCWNKQENTLFLYSLKSKRYKPIQANVLTVRHNIILYLYGIGLSRKDIAELLCISANTVNYHIKEIKNKLRVNNLSNALVLTNEFEFV